MKGCTLVLVWLRSPGGSGHNLLYVCLPRLMFPIHASACCKTYLPTTEVALEQSGAAKSTLGELRLV